MATSIEQKPTAQRHTQRPPNQPSPNSILASSSNSGAAASPPHKRKEQHVILTHTATRRDILRTELEENFPGKHWFDSYDSLDRQMLQEYGKSKSTSKTLLGRLPILLSEDQNGKKHWVGLQAAVRDAISYLLDVEADWNPVTEISHRPQGSLKPLWEGKLFLGGIKDASDEYFLRTHHVSGVVSIHPNDWLWKDTCGRLFKNELYEKPDEWKVNPEKEDKQIMQHAIHLDDDPSSDLHGKFWDAFKFMDDYLLQGKNVLVHCKMGQSRSASLVLGYMMFRYYQTHLAPMTDMKASEKLENLKASLERFIGELSIPNDEPNRNMKRTVQGKRRGASTDKFQAQLSHYLKELSKDEFYKKQPIKQIQPAEKKAGGGIIKAAILVLCFLQDLEPTGEILGYWSSWMKTNEHYWIAASEEKAEREGTRVKDHLASFNSFFQDHLEARQKRISCT